MKSYLLDTHTLLWMQDNHPSLSTNSIEILTNAENNLYVSIVSFWEISIKQSLNKLELSYNLDDLNLACKESRVSILPISINELSILQKLPFIHRDPFDRLIIATAISLNYILISRDAYFDKYEIKVVW